MTDRTTEKLPDDEFCMYGTDCAYDPFEEAEEKDSDERAETFGYLGSPDEAVPAPPASGPAVPARERIERLFADMPPYRGWFLKLIEACKEPRDLQGVGEVVEDLRSRRRCVYTAANFCAMLESAGAFEKVTCDGLPYSEVEPQLEEVEEDGKTFLRPTPPPEALWRSTPEALEVLADNDPLAALLQIVEDQKDYTGVFAEILEMCDGDGSSIGQIKSQVNSNPALEYPKKTAQFFMDYLDRNGAIEWDGAWKITEVGRDLLERLR